MLDDDDLKEHLPEVQMMFAALILYVEDALNHAADKKPNQNLPAYLYEQAYDDITGRQVMLRHLCRFIPIEPEYVARLFRQRLRELG